MTDLMERARNPKLFGGPVAERLAWPPKDIANVKAWRSQTPPVGFRECGERLSPKRTAEAVRCKLIALELAEKRARENPSGFPAWARFDYAPEFLVNRDEDLIRANRRDGGFTAYSTFQMDPVSRPRMWGFCLPMIGAFAIPRPEGWKDGPEITTDTPTDIIAHLAELSRRWRADDVANFQLQPLTEED